MTVTVSDVRTFLADLPSAVVSDAAITKCIDLASGEVDATKSKDASSTDIDRAVLLRAAWYTMQSYAAAIERATGIVPPAALERLRDLKEASERWLLIVSRAATVVGAPVAMTTPVEEME